MTGYYSIFAESRIIAYLQHAESFDPPPERRVLRACLRLPSFPPLALVPCRQVTNFFRVWLCLLLTLAAGGLVVPPLTPAQESSALPSATALAIDKVQLHQALLDLTNPWTVMCIAAHPDDEDGTSLTILRRKYGVHTVSLFSTYGEGGQNAVGPELYEELGVIRARETMEAAEIQGSTPYFLGLKDFGFSKSADEAFRVWGHNEALRRMVLKIRELRPDVIITHHDTTSGHGHHQATGRLILEAFDAAADPRRFPEQLIRLSVWQPLRLFVRFRFPGGASTAAHDPATTERLVTIDPNERDPVRQTTYAEQALEALQRHATQGPWPKTIAARLRAQNNTSGKLPLIRYRLAREAQHAPLLTAEATNFLDGLSLAKSTGARLGHPAIDGRSMAEFIDQPEKVRNALIDWRRQPPLTSQSPTNDHHRVGLIAARGNRALVLASGITLTVSSRSAVLVAGVPASFTITLSNTGDRTVLIHRLSFESWDTKIQLDAAEQLLGGTETEITVDQVTPKGAAMTLPRSDHLYDGRLSGQRFVADADLEIDGAKISLSAEIKRDVAPAVEIKSISPSVYVWTRATVGRPWTFDITLTNHMPTPFRGRAVIIGVNGLIHEVRNEIVLQPRENRDLRVQAFAVAHRGGATGDQHSGVAIFSIMSLDSGEVIVERHLRTVYSEARVAEGLRVGYLPSFDRTLEQSLAALGVEAKELSVDDIQKGELADYTTIIVDNRGYQAHPELIAENSRLLNHVAQGGTLIVFYHKDNEWNPNPGRSHPQLAPYPIILGGERVTEETAPIKFLQPRHRLLNVPNRITQADFGNWIQERGLYYPKEWDTHYQAIFSSQDKGEAPLDGGLLVAQYGRGNYLYTSMVWYRQLAAGVPGAYRMFANMISYGHSPKRRFQRRAARK